MRLATPLRCFIFLLLLWPWACPAVRTAGAAARVQCLRADLDRDGRVERVVMDPRRDPSLSVWHGAHRLWQGVPRRWHPWKLRLADVDGDGKREIAVGLSKATRFFPQPHHCLFLYSFDGKTVKPKWLGSSLSKPFTDFAFVPMGRGHPSKLVSVEITREGKQCVVVYSWSGFGFTADRQRGAWKSARLIEDGRGEVLVEADSGRIPVGRGWP